MRRSTATGLEAVTAVTALAGTAAAFGAESVDASPILKWVAIGAAVVGYASILASCRVDEQQSVPLDSNPSEQAT